jgi:hypothetical protein
VRSHSEKKCRLVRSPDQRRVRSQYRASDGAAIGRVFQFLQEECPNHRLERLGGTPVGHWIFVGIAVVLELGDEVGRDGRLVDDRRGLLCQRQFPDREWIDIFSVLID